VIYNCFRINLFLLRIVLLKSFNFRTNLKSILVSNHLFSDSFNFSKLNRSNKLIVLSYFKTIFKIEVKNNTVNSKISTLVFDNQNGAKNQRENYINFFSPNERLDFSSYKGNLFFENIFQKIICVIISFPFALFYFMISQFYSNRSSFAMFFEYSIVLSNLISRVKKNCINKVYYFSIYDPQSNLFTYFLQKYNVNVHKIASDTPLSFWNKNILTNNLILCNYHQFDEIENNNINLIYDNVLFWGPENIHNFNNSYFNKDTDEINIAFYSTASWLRNEQGNISKTAEYFQQENQLVKYLSSYVFENQHIKLYILLHPKEKLIDQTYILEHYQNLIDAEVDFEIVGLGTFSFNEFSRFNLGVAFHSSVMHERIFCGFKSLFFSTMNVFPLKNTILSRISANNKVQLFKLMDESIEMKTNVFFEKFDLEKYTHNNFKN
jgi:hypothetical protein